MSYCGTGLDLRKTMFSFFNFKYDNMYIKNVSHLLDHRKHPKARISRVEHTLDIWFSVRDLAFCRDILGISLPGVPPPTILYALCQERGYIFISM